MGTDQNTPQWLRTQAAARELHRRAAKWFSLQAIVAVGVPVLFSLAAVRWETLGISPWLELIALYGILASAADEFALEPIIKGTMAKIAAVQELYDCHVLGISRDRWLQMGIPPEAEVQSLAENYKRRYGSYERLMNWYPSIDAAASPAGAALACQRANLWWSAKTRRRTGYVFTGVTLIVLVAFMVRAILGQVSFAGWVLQISAALPAINWLVRNGRRQLESERALRDALVAAEAAQDAGANGDEVRRMQDRLYEYRKGQPVSPNWVYKQFRARDEQEMIDQVADRR